MTGTSTGLDEKVAGALCYVVGRAPARPPTAGCGFTRSSRMLGYLRRRWNSLADDSRDTATGTLSYLRRAENLLIAGGILAVTAGIMILAQGFSQMPAAAVLVLGLGLFAGSFRRRIGWLLTVVALVLLGIDALV